LARISRLRTIISLHFKISPKEADMLIGQGRVRVNGKPSSPVAKIEEADEISADGKIIRAAKKFVYMKFYKPRGIECTLNAEIENNLLTVFHFPEKLFPVGRLDKESEGLLLMTNDGNFYRNTAWTEAEKEKEYLVTVNNPIDDNFIEQMENGIIIMGKKTKPAKVIATGEKEFRIILTQGLNRQIRRMCYKLGYKVEKLVRVRIDKIVLGNMNPGECLQFQP
jgi:23S rRNA pseudouridine2604 synthase